MGVVGERETARGVESSIERSFHVTEEWFAMHDNHKRRVLSLVLETAKEAWCEYDENNPRVLQYIDDGMLQHIYKLDGRKFAEADYGVVCSDGQADKNLLLMMQQWTHAAMQNDKVRLSTLMGIMRETSTSSKIRKVEQAEEEQHQRELEMVQATQQDKQAIDNAKMMIEKMRIDQAERLKMAEIESEIRIKKMELDAKEKELLKDSDRDGIADNVEILKLRDTLRFKREELQATIKDREERLALDEKMHKEDIKSKEKIANKKIPALK